MRTAAVVLWLPVISFAKVCCLSCAVLPFNREGPKLGQPGAFFPELRVLCRGTTSFLLVRRAASELLPISVFPYVQFFLSLRSG